MKGTGKSAAGRRRMQPKRWFGACILFLMSALAVCTAAFAADGPNNSYVLKIYKLLDGGGADGEVYTFLLQGYTYNKDGKIADINSSVTIPGGGMWEFDFGAPAVITVAELTNPGTGLDYTDRTVSTYISGTSETVTISKGNGAITITRDNDPTRPETQTTTMFRVAYLPFDDHLQVAWEEKYFELGPGETEELGGEGSGLPMGAYTIEELKAPPGFSIETAEFSPQANSDDGVNPPSTTVYINSDNGSLTIYAPEADDNGELTHYYTVAKDGSDLFEDIAIASGGSKTLENLSKGAYTITATRSETAAVEGYTVTYTRTDSSKRTVTSANLSTGSSRSYTSFTTMADAVYIDTVGFGPLYDASGAKITSAASYTFNFGIRGTSGIDRKLYGNASSGSGSYTFNSTKPGNANYARIYPTDGKVYVSTTNLNAADAKKIGVSWVEYFQKEEQLTCPKAGAVYKLTVDDRGWIEISKPKGEGEGLGSFYDYMICTDAKCTKPITRYTLITWDKEGEEGEEVVIDVADGDEHSTAVLDEGAKCRIKDLDAGTYYIRETVYSDYQPYGFTVKVDSETLSTVTNSQEFTSAAGQTFTLRKTDDGSGDTRIYRFKIVNTLNNDEVKTVEVRAGEPSEIADLPAGTYRTELLNGGNAGFRLEYNDSSTVTVNGNSAAITFTNHFTEQTGSYRFIHEYYLKKPDGSCILEGVSAVETRNGEIGTEVTHNHQASEITIMPNFTVKVKGEDGITETEITRTYQHCGDAYGVAYALPSGSDGPPENWAGNIVEDTSYPYRGEGMGPDSKWKYTYKAVEGKTFVTPQEKIDEDGGPTEIIILRYVREEKEAPAAPSYKVVHLYYYQGSDGSITYEGREEITAGVLTNEDTYTQYKADGVDKQFEHTTGDGTLYRYEYRDAAYGVVTDGADDIKDDKFYTADTGKDYVNATADGDQIIVLKYYRVDAGMGSYKVVHEYYYRTRAEEPDDIESGGTEAGENGGRDEHGLSEADDGGTGGGGDSDGFDGTLESRNDGYVYTYEGMSEICTFEAPRHSVHYGDEVKPEYTHTPVNSGQGSLYEYTRFGDDDGIGYGIMAAGASAPYTVKNEMGAAATEQGDQVIILRYYRTDPSEKPEEPPREPENPPKGPEDPPQNPDQPSGPPDPNDPDSPDEITIWEDGIPVTHVKQWDPENEKWIYVKKAPRTGDGSHSGIWILLAAGSFTGIIMLCRRRDQMGRS